MAAGTMNAEDQQLMERLRDKYTNMQGSLQAEPNDASGLAQTAVCTSGSTRSGGAVQAAVCPDCQGQGIVYEYYNHRRLERFCVDCDGRGVFVTRSGQVSTPPAVVPSGRNRIGSSNHPPSQQQWPAAGPEIDPDAQKEKLHQDVQKLDGKLQEYAAELAGLRAQAQEPSTANDPERASLLADVAAGVEAQVARLEAIRAKKMEALQRVTSVLS